MTVGLIISLVFGLMYGSFLNVVIVRFDDWRSIITGRSRCPECRERLRWYDLVPVVSYATLRGRCRYCHRPINWQYPVVEAATGLLLAGGYWLVFGASLVLVWQVIAFVAFIGAIGCLMTIFFEDLSEMMVSDFFSYGLLIFGLIFSLAFYQNALDTLYGGLVGLIPVALLVYPSRKQWMGEGDLKLAAGLGLLVAYPNAIVGLAFAFIIGGLYALYLLLTGQAKLKTAVPFGPFLILGGLIALFWGTAIITWYMAGKIW